MQCEIGVKISYSKAFRIKECTNKINNGTHESAYLALLKYYQDLEFNNPNSSAIPKKIPKNKFQWFHKLEKKFKHYCILNAWDIIVVKFLIEIIHSTKSKAKRLYMNTLSTWQMKLAVVMSGSSWYLYLSFCTNWRDINVVILLLWWWVKMKTLQAM